MHDSGRKDVEVKKVKETNVPALGLGTWRLKGSECGDTVRTAIELGYRHIDTAQTYGNEAEVGQGIRDSSLDRAELFVTTKIDVENLSPQRLLVSAADSFRKLGIDYVDLLLIHWPHAEVPLEDSLDAMRKLQEEGLVRHIGVSNFTPELVRQALQIAPIFCNQVEFHPYLDQSDILDLAEKNDFLVTAYCPIARGAVLEDPVLRRIAESRAKNAAQVALRWLVQQPKVAAIPKAASRIHLESNLDIFDFELSRQEMEEIAALANGLRLVNPT